MFLGTSIIPFVAHTVPQVLQQVISLSLPHLTTYKSLPWSLDSQIIQPLPSGRQSIHLQQSKTLNTMWMTLATAQHKTLENYLKKTSTPPPFPTLFFPETNPHCPRTCRSMILAYLSVSHMSQLPQMQGRDAHLGCLLVRDMLTC